MDYSMTQKALSEQSIEAIKKFGESFHAEKNDIIFHEGTAAHAIFFLESGQIRVSRVSIEGKETIIKYIYSSEFFGEVILTGMETYPSTASASKKSLLTRIPVNIFKEMLQEQPFTIDFIAVLLHKLHFVTNRLHICNCYGVEGRFFQFLLDRYGPSDSYTIDLSKKEIAAAVGTIPETLSRLINKLQKDKIISWHDNTIILQKDYWKRFQNHIHSFEKD